MKGHIIMKKGILYGVGVGPGDPELMTLLAVKTIKNCSVTAVPTARRDDAASYRIAVTAVPEIAERECLTLDTPMTKDPERLEAAYRAAAEAVIEHLEHGANVAYLVLGDPCIYSTYIYIHRLVCAAGFSAKIINGVTSFCAASARLSDSLIDRSEQLHIIPSSYDTKEAMQLPGTKVLMKAASRMKELKKELESCGASSAVMIENCGMENERIYEGIDAFPESCGYFSTVIVRSHDRPISAAAEKFSSDKSDKSDKMIALPYK